jgi:mannose-6-phosphate isomerase-like protein (cupin superfamily)
MVEARGPALLLENRHTGERLAISRVRKGDEAWFLLEGQLPPHREGPPLHIHFSEDEEGRVKSGTLSVLLDGRRFTAGPGESAVLPRGLAHRWWNESDEPLEFSGITRPAVDFDRYLQAVFEVVNAGPPGRPPLFYMAHVALRHRQTQAVLLMPRLLQAVLFRVVVALGTVMGRYRGDDWPGCPSRCTGAPPVAEEGATTATSGSARRVV